MMGTLDDAVSMAYRRSGATIFFLKIFYIGYAWTMVVLILTIPVAFVFGIVWGLIRMGKYIVGEYGWTGIGIMYGILGVMTLATILVIAMIADDPWPDFITQKRRPKRTRK